VPMKNVREKFTGELHLRLDRKHAEGTVATNLQKVFIDHPGECSVFFHVPTDGGDEVVVKAALRYSVKPNDTFHEAVTKIIDPSCVQYQPVHGKIRETRRAEVETAAEQPEMMEEMDV